jgi:hypothetical protein
MTFICAVFIVIFRVYNSVRVLIYCVKIRCQEMSSEDFYVCCCYTETASVV